MTNAEGLLLALIIERRRPVHGLDLGKEAGIRFGRVLSAATLYRSLHHLEDAGLVIGAWEREHGSRSERHRGPPRRYYRITAAGEQALDRHVLEVRRTASAFGLPIAEQGT